MHRKRWDLHLNVKTKNNKYRFCVVYNILYNMHIRNVIRKLEYIDDNFFFYMTYEHLTYI